MTTIFEHYRISLQKTIDNIPKIIKKTMEYLNEDLLDSQESRLSKSGEYVDGAKLRTDTGVLNDMFYSPNNEKYYPVDLYDTGEFYRSMEVIANEYEISFLADFDKEGGHIADNFTVQKTANDFVQSVLGLTRKNWSELAPFFIKYFIYFFKLYFNKLIK